MIVIAKQTVTDQYYADFTIAHDFFHALQEEPIAMIMTIWSRLALGGDCQLAESEVYPVRRECGF